MYRVEQITNNSKQKRTLVLPDGSLVTFTMEYIPLQQGWFINSLTYGDFILNGFKITNSPNMLHQYKNKLPFGIACISGKDITSGGMREPTQQDDFVSEFSKMYLLDEDELIAYTEFLSGS